MCERPAAPKRDSICRHTNRAISLGRPGAGALGERSEGGSNSEPMESRRLSRSRSRLNLGFDTVGEVIAAFKGILVEEHVLIAKQVT